MMIKMSVNCEINNLLVNLIVQLNRFHKMKLNENSNKNI
jgi:hypothetical protein